MKPKPHACGVDDNADASLLVLSMGQFKRALLGHSCRALKKGRFRWWPTGLEAARTLRAHQAQMLLAAGDPDAAAAPVWRRVNA